MSIKSIIASMLASSLGFFPIVEASFDTDVIGTSPEQEILASIALPSYTFANGKTQTRYNNAKRFIQAFKNEVSRRYDEGVIDYYQMNDIIRDFDALVWALNGHFFAAKRYERTRSKIYLEETNAKLEEARQLYQTLHISTKN
jgi:hypothetical protein